MENYEKIIKVLDKNVEERIVRNYDYNRSRKTEERNRHQDDYMKALIDSLLDRGC